MSNEFPLFRRLGDLQVFIKITDERHFTEVRKVGKKWLVSEIQANQFPEILRIKDMISSVNPFLEISYEDFYRNTKEAQNETNI
jgi:hypothetical protein